LALLRLLPLRVSKLAPLAGITSGTVRHGEVLVRLLLRQSVAATRQPDELILRVINCRMTE